MKISIFYFFFCKSIIKVYGFSGLMAEGVYKVSGVKSRVQYVYGLYNKRKTVYESDFDLTIATSLLKQFLRFDHEFSIIVGVESCKNILFEISSF